MSYFIYQSCNCIAIISVLYYVLHRTANGKLFLNFKRNKQIISHKGAHVFPHNTYETNSDIRKLESSGMMYSIDASFTIVKYVYTAL